MASKNLDGVLIKKAHQKENYTLEQLQHLEKCMDPVNGALYFCKNFLKIQHPTRGAITFEPYEFQERLIQAYNDNTYSIAMLPRQMGKAICNETPVLTPTGFKKMGELQVGDTIYTPKGTPTEVTFITETMTNRTCYEIEFAHGESIIADAHHLWTWYDPLYNDLITENTEYLIKRFNKYKTTNQRLSIDHTKPIEFEKKPLKLDPYLVGLWMGNNPEVNKLKCYNFEYQRYQEMFKSHGLSMSELKLNRHSNRLGTYTVNNLEYMVKPVLNSDNTLPEDLMMNDIETRVKLISGIMDACGSVEETGYCTFKHNDEKITEQVKFMLSTLGVKSVLKVEHCKFKTNYYLKFATTAFRLFTLSEKVDNAAKSNHWPSNERIYIKNIAKAPSVPVRCLQVADKKHLFLVGKTLIPTHNTTCACGYLLWYTMFVPEAQVLIAAHKYVGAQDIMNRYRYGYENLPDFIRAGVYSYNRNTIEYDNGARIQATTTTENTGRGKSLSLIYCDEFAHIEPPEKAREFWTALSPTLSTGGRCIITSTPNSDEDQFADIWHQANKKFDKNGIEQSVGENGFYPFFAYWHEHPDRDDEWAFRERSKIGSVKFDREFNCLESMTYVTLQDEDGNVFSMTIGDLYNQC